MPHTYSWLSGSQREEFRKHWYCVSTMRRKWEDTTPGNQINLFSNKKALEKEVEDLEDLSLAAYRAMKKLKQMLADDSNKCPCGSGIPEEVMYCSGSCVKKYTCPCGKSLNESLFSRGENYYCNLDCYQKHSKHINLRACHQCALSLEGAGFLQSYGKYFCGSECLSSFEDEGTDGYAG